MLSSSGQIFFSFYVFEMSIFGKLMKRRFQWYIGLPTFLLLFLLCVQSSKSCREGSLDDIVSDVDNDSNLVADIDPGSLIRIVRSELKRGKALGQDNTHKEILKKAIDPGFSIYLARAFTLSIKPAYTPYAWKIAVLCILIKSDKLLSQTTSYRSIYQFTSSSNEALRTGRRKRPEKHLEDSRFSSKYQSGFGKSKPTSNHLARLSQTVIESFNRGKNQEAAFLDTKKAMGNVWHSELRY